MAWVTVQGEDSGTSEFLPETPYCGQYLQTVPRPSILHRLPALSKPKPPSKVPPSNWSPTPPTRGSCGCPCPNLFRASPSRHPSTGLRWRSRPVACPGKPPSSWWRRAGGSRGPGYLRGRRSAPPTPRRSPLCSAAGGEGDRGGRSNVARLAVAAGCDRQTYRGRRAASHRSDPPPSPRHAHACRQSSSLATRTQKPVTHAWGYRVNHPHWYFARLCVLRACVSARALQLSFVCCSHLLLQVLLHPPCPLCSPQAPKKMGIYLGNSSPSRARNCSSH